MEAVGFWPRGIEPCGRRRSGFGTPKCEHSTPYGLRKQECSYKDEDVVAD
jgi:hypothetical protein